MNSSKAPLDGTGPIAAAVAMGGLTYGVIEAGADGFGAPRVLIALGLAVLALIVFLTTQARGRHPMVPLNLFRSRGVVVPLLGGFAFTVGFYGGPGSDWFRGTRARREGRIEADGVEKDVTLTDADGEIDSEVGAAYRTKYGRYSANTIARITSPVAGSTTCDRCHAAQRTPGQTSAAVRLPTTPSPSPHWRTGAYRPRIRRHFGDRTARADHRRAP
ncbi:DUF2255 family protein [Streptomyces sp. NPDC056704]|uniref:DUF2255 family protein n=1 Tax=Streptomyces sp. NPDC056704 TaxID=3345917 RepID=UPI0036CA2FE5